MNEKEESNSNNFTLVKCKITLKIFLVKMFNK